jgi:hypothetical protein
MCYGKHLLTQIYKIKSQWTYCYSPLHSSPINVLLEVLRNRFIENLPNTVHFFSSLGKMHVKHISSSFMDSLATQSQTPLLELSPSEQNARSNKKPVLFSSKKSP